MSDLYLIHHGIKGQKWGVRNYQNEDGSLTEDGKKRYLKGNAYTTAYRLRSDMKQSIRKHKEQFRTDKKALKEAYKSGDMTKKDYKDKKNKLHETLNKEVDKENKNIIKVYSENVNHGKAKVEAAMGIIGGMTLTGLGSLARAQGDTTSNILGAALLALGGTAIGSGVAIASNEIVSGVTLASNETVSKKASK